LGLTEQIPAKSISSIALAACRTYDPGNVRTTLHRSLEMIGSPERFIKPGDRILIKPNMLSAKEPEHAVTTHPEIIAAVGEIVLDCRGRIILGDSPGGAAKNIKNYWNKTGISAVAKRLNIEPVSFEKSSVKSFKAPGGFVNISTIALEADGIINLPKLKTHILTKMTGAVKNMFGTIPGFRKGFLHSLAPEPDDFAKFVFAAYKQVVPNLNIMDAIVGMEGNGPSSGQPRHIGAILISEDALALDSIAARIMGFDVRELPMFKAAVEAGYWQWDSDPVDLYGDPIEEFIAHNFLLPDVSKLERLPDFVKNNLKRLIWIRPQANPEVCTACNLCVESCPVEAMSMVRDVPLIDYNVCIKCGCCDEVCPENAIEQKMSLLARLLA